MKLAVQHDRETYERERRARGEDYHYPAHLIGPDEVHQPQTGPREPTFCVSRLSFDPSIWPPLS